MISLRRGDIRGSSFSFIVAPGGVKWSTEGGVKVRTITKFLHLGDVGPVVNPAYPATSSGVADALTVARSSPATFSDRSPAYWALRLGIKS